MKLPTLFFLALLANQALAGVDEDWQQIVALDAGPKAEWKTRDEARRVTLAHLDRQEKALRDFLVKYPADAHDVDAQLRLAHLLATRGNLQGDAKDRAEAAQLLNRLGQIVPAEKRADVEFAKLSLFMEQMTPGDENRRELLFNKAHTFAKTFPGDCRIAALFAEVATLYDAHPQRKKELLEAARAVATDAELQQRIDDDLKRLAFLGKTVPLAFTSTRGEAIDAEKLRGKVVLVYFFADWSPPSVATLDSVREIAASFPSDRVQALGISLDENSAALAELLRTHHIDWPIFCDGKGWQSPFVRSLGINALPTFWILDRSGRLRTLNARGEAPGLIAQLLREH